MPIPALGLEEELLLIVSCPVAAPVVVGSNSTVSVAVWFELSVNGKAAPENENPEPVITTELTVTGAAPVEVKVMDCVAGVLRMTLPKATLVALMDRVGKAPLSCRAKD